jgi:hypothetical protein
MVVLKPVPAPKPTGDPYYRVKGRLPASMKPDKTKKVVDIPSRGITLIIEHVQDWLVPKGRGWDRQTRAIPGTKVILAVIPPGSEGTPIRTGKRGIYQGAYFVKNVRVDSTIQELKVDQFGHITFERYRTGVVVSPRSAYKRVISPGDIAHTVRA